MKHKIQKLHWLMPKDHKVGDEVKVQVAAPGYGEVIYQITSISSRGVFGRVVRNTAYEFTAADVF